MQIIYAPSFTSIITFYAKSNRRWIFNFLQPGPCVDWWCISLPILFQSLSNKLKISPSRHEAMKAVVLPVQRYGTIMPTHTRHKLPHSTDEAKLIRKCDFMPWWLLQPATCVQGWNGVLLPTDCKIPEGKWFWISKNVYYRNRSKINNAAMHVFIHCLWLYVTVLFLYCCTVKRNKCWENVAAVGGIVTMTRCAAQSVSVCVMDERLELLWYQADSITNCPFLSFSLSVIFRILHLILLNILQSIFCVQIQCDRLGD